MERDPIQTSSRRFNRISANYAASEIHRDSPTIARLHEFLSGKPLDAVCDVACGAGYLGLSFAGKSKRIVAVDPAPNMLEAARRLAAERGVALETCDAYAESMALADGEFDLVGCRVAAHHFADVRQAIREMARIARPGGRIAIIDLEGPDDPEYDDFNHQLEMLHDPTHVRSYRASEWRQILDAAGLEIETLDNGLRERPAGVTLKRWCEISASGEDAELEIGRLLRGAKPGLLAALGIRETGGEFVLTIRTLLAVGRKKPLR